MNSATQLTPSFHWPVRVYYEDTDGGGVVYHANYLKFMERARTEWLRSLGLEQTTLRSDMNILFVVREVQLKFLRPACFNDAIEVVSHLVRVGRSLLEFEQTILRGDETLTKSRVEVVCIDAQRFKPTAIPASIKTALTEFA